MKKHEDIVMDHIYDLVVNFFKKKKISCNLEAIAWCYRKCLINNDKFWIQYNDDRDSFWLTVKKRITKKSKNGWDWKTIDKIIIEPEYCDTYKTKEDYLLYVNKVVDKFLKGIPKKLLN